MMRFLRSAFVIARRDFSATVLSKAFIFFLLAPLFPLLMGGVFGGIGARVASQTERPVIAVVTSSSEFDRLVAARDELGEAIPEGSLVSLVHYAPTADIGAQERELLQTRKPAIRAVLSGSLEHPHVTGSLGSDPGTSGQLRLLISTALAGPREDAPEIDVTNVTAASGSLAKDRALTAQIGQMLLFFLTILLSGMLLSQLIEEKSNKIIEVIAAAVPIDALFVGKLFAMLCASILGIVVWISSGAVIIQFIKQGGVQTLPPPAVGWPMFLALAILYFGMNYLLLGAAFLTIGAQASTVREVQTMSMPVTFAQVLIFGFASTVIGNPDSTQSLAAALFPLSSPMAMIARAAEQPELWPHLIALVWQGLWVAMILRFGSQLFRKTVFKSGPRGKRWSWFSRASSGRSAKS
jgi:ABC-2 type transport system permease protein